MIKTILIFIIIPSVAFAASCPTGMVAVEYDNFVSAVSGACPAGYVAHNITDVCASDTTGACWLVRVACGAGVTQLKASGGLNFPLYSTRATTPSLCVGYNNTTCYVDLESGSATGAINIHYNGVTYHTIK